MSIEPIFKTYFTWLLATLEQIEKLLSLLIPTTRWPEYSSTRYTVALGRLGSGCSFTGSLVTVTAEKATLPTVPQGAPLFKNRGFSKWLQSICCSSAVKISFGLVFS